MGNVYGLQWRMLTKEIGIYTLFYRIDFFTQQVKN